jgi:hypothetical protein
MCLLALRCCAGTLGVREMKIEAANAKQQEHLEHMSAHANDDVDLLQLQ